MYLDLDIAVQNFPKLCRPLKSANFYDIFDIVES